MAHELGKKWKSRVGKDLASLSDDLLGQFDLTNMSSTGSATGCKREPSGEPITGITEALTIQGAPTARFLVRIDQASPFELHYRGVAILNPATSQINKIVGIVRAPILPFTKDDLEAALKRKPEAKALLSQEEATWVATQP